MQFIPNQWLYRIRAGKRLGSQLAQLGWDGDIPNTHYVRHSTAKGALGDVCRRMEHATDTYQDRRTGTERSVPLHMYWDDLKIDNRWKHADDGCFIVDDLFTVEKLYPTKATADGEAVSLSLNPNSRPPQGELDLHRYQVNEICDDIHELLEERNTERPRIAQFDRVDHATGDSTYTVPRKDFDAVLKKIAGDNPPQEWVQAFEEFVRPRSPQYTITVPPYNDLWTQSLIQSS